MQKLIASDREKTWLDEGQGWDPETLRDEIRGEKIDEA